MLCVGKIQVLSDDGGVRPRRMRTDSATGEPAFGCG